MFGKTKKNKNPNSECFQICCKFQIPLSESNFAHAIINFKVTLHVFFLIRILV